MVKLGYIYTDDPIEARMYIKAQDIVSYTRAWKVHKDKHEYHNEEACIKYTMAILREMYNLGHKAVSPVVVAPDPQDCAQPLLPLDKAD